MLGSGASFSPSHYQDSSSSLKITYINRAASIAIRAKQSKDVIMYKEAERIAIK